MSELTARQQHILSMLMQGHSNGEISSRLGLKEQTVKAHLYRIYKKIGVKSRSQAMALQQSERTQELHTATTDLISYLRTLGMTDAPALKRVEAALSNQKTEALCTFPR